MPNSDLHSFGVTFFLTGRQKHDYGSSDNLPWPSYRRAVDLIFLGHAKKAPA